MVGNIILTFVFAIVGFCLGFTLAALAKIAADKREEKGEPNAGK